MTSKLEMYELPLFPLDVVLFPGMPLPLHIFEERYKSLIADCIRENRAFGVVLLEEGHVDTDPQASHVAVGCTAAITQVQPLDEGRMFIMSVGQERFRVVSVDHGKPYLVGTVLPAPLTSDQGHHETTAAEKLGPLVLDYLDRLSRIGDVEIDADPTANDAEDLAYLAATLIQLPVAEKQALLSIDRTADLLHALSLAYRRELTLMNTLPDEDIGIFSMN